ncbi:MAG: hypothetical protein WD851_03545 [Pirellulales bacterium]
MNKHFLSVAAILALHLTDGQPIALAQFGPRTSDPQQQYIGDSTQNPRQDSGNRHRPSGVRQIQQAPNPNTLRGNGNGGGHSGGRYTHGWGQRGGGGQSSNSHSGTRVIIPVNPWPITGGYITPRPIYRPPLDYPRPDNFEPPAPVTVPDNVLPGGSLASPGSISDSFGDPNLPRPKKRPVHTQPVVVKSNAKTLPPMPTVLSKQGLESGIKHVDDQIAKVIRAIRAELAKVEASLPNDPSVVALQEKVNEAESAWKEGTTVGVDWIAEVKTGLDALSENMAQANDADSANPDSGETKSSSLDAVRRATGPKSLAARLLSPTLLGATLLTVNVPAAELIGPAILAPALHSSTIIFPFSPSVVIVTIQEYYFMLPPMLEVVVIFKNALTVTGFAPIYPTGITPVVMMPVIPANKVFLIAGGPLMVGTGGVGFIKVVNSNPALVLNLPLGIGSPVPNAPKKLSTWLIDGVLLRNLAENAAPINYLVAGRWEYTLEPGSTQHLINELHRQIEFNRGSSGGEASYTLDEGTYAFGPSDKGWDLFRETFGVTIDNTGNKEAFYFVVDNKQTAVKPNGSRRYDSKFPIVVRFNRGDASKEAIKRITQSDDHLAVAINPADGLWDLYPASNAPPEPTTAEADGTATFSDAPPEPEAE